MGRTKRKGDLVGYARVSTVDQDHDLQVDALNEAGCVKVFTEKASGAKADRPALLAAMEYMREGDTLVVWKLDRLGRSLTQLIKTVEELSANGMGFKCLTNEAIDTTNASGKLVFNIFAALSEFERELIQERTKAGLQAAKRRGRVGGRPRLVDDAKLNAARALIASDISVRDAAEQIGVNYRTLYRALEKV